MTQAVTLAVPYSLDLSVHQMKEEDAKEAIRGVVEKNGICLGVSLWILLTAFQVVSHPEYTRDYNQSASLPTYSCSSQTSQGLFPTHLREEMWSCKF